MEPVWFRLRLILRIRSRGCCRADSETAGNCGTRLVVTARCFQDTGPLSFPSGETCDWDARGRGRKAMSVVKSESLMMGRESCIPVGQGVKISG